MPGSVMTRGVLYTLKDVLMATVYGAFLLPELHVVVTRQMSLKRKLIARHDHNLYSQINQMTRHLSLIQSLGSNTIY